MAKVYMLIGVPGVGKSTWSKTKANAIVLSSDEIRTELFNKELNGVQDQVSHQLVFSEMFSRLKDSFQTNQDIIYDATNLNRRKRKHLYTEIKRLSNYEVVAVVFLKPLKTILEQNKNRKNVVPEEVVKQKYINLQVPKIGLDCDYIERPYGKNIDEFEHEFEGDTSHNSSYHKESVREHINMTIENSYNEQLREIAAYHDLGKFIAKEDMENGYSNFIGHQNVSAFYHLASLDELNSENLLITEVIYLHMLAHQGITEKSINRNNITEREQELLEEFNKIDQHSRIV